MEANLCVLCKHTGNDSCGKTVEVKRGLNELIKCSISKRDDVQKFLKDKETVVVHVKCRKDYTRHSESVTKTVEDHKCHAARHAFDYKTQCIFCEKLISVDVKKFRKKKC